MDSGWGEAMSIVIVGHDPNHPLLERKRMSEDEAAFCDRAAEVVRVAMLAATGTHLCGHEFDISRALFNEGFLKVPDA